MFNNWKTCLGPTLLGLMALTTAAEAETTLKALFMAQSAYSESDVRAMTAKFSTANPDIKVNLEFVPFEALRDKTILSFGSGGGYDVVLYDVIWPAEYAANNILLDVTDRIAQETVDAIFPGAMTTVEYGDRYYGLPWIVDTKFLFYNKKMLSDAGIAEPPKTFAELAEQAQIIKDKGIVDFPIASSWAQAEAAVADYTTYVSAYGGQFVDANNKPAFASGGALDALEHMVDSYNRGLTNPNSKEFLEEDVRRVFQNGDAAFALNWTYMYNLANDPADSRVAGDVGIVPAPGVAGISEASAVNGSMGLGIMTTSKHPEEAWEYITFMVSPEIQVEYARLSMPIWQGVYDDPAVINGQHELMAAVGTGLNSMYPRPTVVNYNEVSLALQQAIQEALLGNMTPAEALAQASVNSGL